MGINYLEVVFPPLWSPTYQQYQGIEGVEFCESISFFLCKGPRHQRFMAVPLEPWCSPLKQKALAVRCVMCQCNILSEAIRIVSPVALNLSEVINLRRGE